MLFKMFAKKFSNKFHPFTTIFYIFVYHLPIIEEFDHLIKQNPEPNKINKLCEMGIHLFS